ncbi:MAG: hypothetical protein U9Q82_06200 [Chloroflexota bacterium]|nr:hypothetical protein [Chloroflexota bacterium]
MYKLIILIGPVAGSQYFRENWPEFLHNAEDMPYLIREASVHVHATLYGEGGIHKIHELFFATLNDLQAALESPQGQAAGQMLQKITHGHMTLLTAEHKQDNMENLRKLKRDESHQDTKPQ